MLRKAKESDISRIAEILIITKRLANRRFFNNDHVSFNVMQVRSEIERLKQPHELDQVYVYDDGIVKATININVELDRVILTNLYVDQFFQGEGIGTYILKTIIEKYPDKEIHVNPIEANTRLINYYERLGFIYTGNRYEYFDTGVFLRDYCYKH